MLIPLKDWAVKVGISPCSARQKAGRGNLPAVKMGRDWMIEDDVPNTDHRANGLSERWKSEEENNSMSNVRK